MHIKKLVVLLLGKLKCIARLFTNHRTAMHPTTRLIGATACVLACLAGHAVAAPVERQKEIRTYTVERDGSFVEVAELVIRVNETSAVAAAAQQQISYNRANSTLEVLDAYTQKSDGSKVPVGAAGIKDQQHRFSVSAPQYLDRRVKSIIFPHVAGGDRLVYSTRLTRRTPLFAGQFSDLSAPDALSSGQMILIYDLPDAMPLYADERRFVASQLAAPAGRKRYRWDFFAASAARDEVGAVSPLDAGARLAVTTFADYAALARAYEAASRAQATVTPALAQMAKARTAHLAAARDKAEVLGNLVRSMIRPVSVAIADANSLAPHSADQVVTNRYGDSRDQVVLLRALLDAAGIANSAALVNGGRAYRLPSVATIDLLDRAIVYLPSLDLYIDPSDRNATAGFLAGSLLDKPTLLTASATLGRTPAGQRNETSVNSNFVVAADGAAEFDSTYIFRGALAEQWRSMGRGAPATARTEHVTEVLRARGQDGHGEWDPGDLGSLAAQHKMRYSGHSDDLATLPGPIGVNAASSLNPMLLTAVTALAGESGRVRDFVCPSQDIEEHARYLFAARVRIIAVPRPLELHDDYFEYSASYERKDNEVSVRRSYKLHHPGRVCSSADFQRMLPSIVAMQRDLNSQLILQTK